MLEIERGWKLCERCQSFDNIGRSLDRGTWIGEVHVSRTSLHEDCVSCASLSCYLADINRVEIKLKLLGQCQIKADMSTQEALVESRFHDTDAATLILIEIWDSVDEGRRHSLIPEEQHSLRFERGREGDLVVNMASANLARAKKWIESCRTHHTSNADGLGKACAVPRVRMKIPLRIIDCKTLRVRALLPNESYICLSYVWGNILPAKAPVNSQLDPAAIPETISDAIFVAEQLGIPRLWVDQYCIDQEKSDARYESIASMHLIYGGAEVTIVAASGTDSSHGLPGVLGTRRMHGGHPFALGSRKFVKYPRLSEEVRRTRWNGRGWTFQEALLSLRLLVFTETQMYFQCAKMHCHESLEAERKNIHNYTQEQVFPTQGIGEYAHNIFERIREYFTRELSFSMDNLKAVEGILEAFGEAHMDEVRARHFYGTPVLYDVDDINGENLDAAQGLCWWIEDHNSDDGYKEHIDSFNPGMPSWTWASRKSACFSWKSLNFTYLHSLVDQIADVKYHVTSRDGEIVDLLQYAISGSKRYSEFYPWIDITTWTVQGHITRQDSGGTNGLTLAGLEDAELHFDDDISQSTGEITAVLLYTGQEDNRTPFHFLLIHPATLGTFSRVGLLFLDCDPARSTGCKFIENPKRYLQSYGLNDDATVERKTVRIV